MNDECTIDMLIQKILTDDKQYDLSKIITAYEFAAKAHEGQTRSSGQPYIIHPLAVSYILLGLGMDTDTICAAMLHDVVEDTPVTLDEVKRKFGQDVAMLVDGVTKLNQVPIFDKEEQRAENDISDKIRTPEVSMNASKVSAIPEVRKFLFGLQKKIAAENNIIMDGRDIGTVVLPDADLKVFLTASAEERANRRYREIKDMDGVTYEQVLEDIKKRDYSDMHRDIAPLKQAEDAVLLDTTGMTVDEVKARLISMISEVE